MRFKCMFSFYFSWSCELKSFLSSSFSFHFWHIFLYFFFLGAIIIIIFLPSNWGIFSTTPYSSSAWANFNNSISPLSLNIIVLPLKKTNALTFAPSWRNFIACFNLKSKSWSPVFGPNLNSFIITFWAFDLIAFCFFFWS